jgi:hypothetical protein
MVEFLEWVLVALRLVVFALALGMTLISFQSYRDRRSKRLESAFIGFAFLAMGVAVANLSAQLGQFVTLLEIVETIPFIVGFSMLYLSLYR